MSGIEESLARLDAGASWTTITSTAGAGPDWLRCSDLIGDRRRLRGWQRDVASSYGGAKDGGLLTGQGLVLDWYLAAVLLPAVGLFHLDRRVPDLAPDRLFLRLAAPDGPAAATAVESGHFGCLPDDTDAGRAQASVVDNVAALADMLRAEVVGHACRLLTAYAPTTRIGRRSLWAAVTDAVDVAFLAGGWISEDMPRAATDAALVLGRAPLVGGSTLHSIEDARARTHWTRRRHSCCFLYRAPSQGPCVTCPRVGPAERLRQAERW